MRGWLQVPLLVLCGLLLAGGGKESVQVRFDRGVDFGRFASFRCLPLPHGTRPLSEKPTREMLQRVEQAIVRELEAKGLAHREHGSDLVIEYALRLPASRRGKGAKRWKFGGGVADTGSHQLAVRVFRADERNLHIWQGAKLRVFAGKLGDDADTRRRLDRAVAEVLADFPPEAEPAAR